MKDNAKVLLEAQSNGELIRLFLLDCRTRGLTGKTAENYGSSIGVFLRHAKVHAYEVDIQDLKRFLVHLREETGYKATTIGAYFSALRSFYEFLEFEGHIQKSPMPRFRRRYLVFLRKGFNSSVPRRQIISVAGMKSLIESVARERDRALMLLLAKTGIRRKELVDIDLNDIDWDSRTIRLKPTPKRTNCTVYFDGEAAKALKGWLEVRKRYGPRTGALFVGQGGRRLRRNGVYTVVIKHAKKVGLHDPTGELNERFTPHCFRHWFTTHLRRSGMPREYIKELRGDARNETMDIYYHIDQEDLRKSYLDHIPQLGL